MKHFRLILLFFSLLEPFLAQSARYYVHQNASGNADGSTWLHAFPDFQQALAVAQDGDEIWVAQGTYKPTLTNNRFLFFNLPNGVAIYGGFGGSETLREQRDWDAHPCILSGDIGAPGDSTDNSFNVIYTYSPNEKTRLDGFIVEEGNANNPDNAIDFHRPTRSGGGLYLDGEHFGYAQLSIANCTFRKNRAFSQGGGIYANGREGGMAIVRLEHCVFEHNTSKTFGGGFSLENYFEQPFALEIKDCVFKENHSLSSGNAVWLRAHQPVKFTHCQFFRNESITGGTVYFNQLENNHPVDFEDCLFEGNGNFTVYYSPNTQALNAADFKFTSCIFSENGLPSVYIYFFDSTEFKAEFKQCVFSRHVELSISSSTLISLLSKGKSTVSFLNCLLNENEDNGINVWNKTDVYINNSIIRDKETNTNAFVLNGPGTYHLSNSLFRQASCALLGGVNTTILCDSSNLFGLSPMFVNPGPGPGSDFRLQPCSPAINAGNNDFLSTLNISTDLQGNPRIRNGNVDLGPYETHVSLQPSILAQPACAGDTNGAVEFDPNICPPFTFSWDNGLDTGTQTDGLAAGTYVFTAIGTNNIPVSDTLVIAAPPALNLQVEAHDSNCNGLAHGWFGVTATGGTPPYVYDWNGFPLANNLPAGVYPISVQDAHGCTANAEAIIGWPEPLQIFATVHPASCMGCSDGSIVFDSVTGGTNPILPASMYNLPVGHYCFTLTDAANCTAVICKVVEAVSGVEAYDVRPEMLKISPNPSATGTLVQLEWLGNEAIVLKVRDAQGRLLDTQNMLSGAQLAVWANWPPGVYLLEGMAASGKSFCQRWVVY